MHVVGWQRRWPRCITHFVMFFFVFKSHMMDFLPDWQTFHRNSCRGTWKCYAMDCFGAYFVHVQTYGLLRSVQHMSKQSATQWPASVHFTHVQTCHNVRVKVLRNDGFGITLRMSKPVITSAFKKCYAMDWVHTLHMSKPVTNFVFKVLRHRLLRCILYIWPSL